jgi:hypothetical protein
MGSIAAHAFSKKYHPFNLRRTTSENMYLPLPDFLNLPGGRWSVSTRHRDRARRRLARGCNVDFAGLDLEVRGPRWFLDRPPHP